MKSRPAIFAADHRRNAADVHWILSIDDGSDSWLFSDTSMVLTDGNVFTLISNGSDITIDQSFDLLTKRFSTSSLDCDLINAEFQRSGTTMLRLSDIISTWLFADVTLYIAAGSRVTSLSDCIVAFVGAIMQPPTYDMEKVRIAAVDKLTLNDHELPSVRLTEDYADPPEDNADKFKQLIYGEFRRADDDGNIHKGTGLAVAYLCTKDAVDPIYFVAGHRCDIIDPDIFFDVNGPSVILAQKGIEEIFGPVTSDPITAIPVTSLSCNQRYAITDTIESGYTVSSGPDTGASEDLAALNSANAHDGNYATYATINDNLADNGEDNSGAGAAVWGIDNQDDLRGHLRQSTGVSLSLRHRGCIKEPTFTGSVSAVPKLYFTKPTSSANLASMTPLDGTDTWHVTSGVSWTSNDIDDVIIIAVIASVAGIGSNDLDGTVDNQAILRIGELQVQLNVDLDDYPVTAWANVRGLEYGSWINSRSSSYSETEYIKDPVGIIESLLRDYIGFGDSDIDMPSFIAAESSDVEMRLNLSDDNKMAATDIIKQLCEQSTIAFCFTADATARVVNMSNNSPTTAQRGGTDVVFTYNDVIPGSMSISQTEVIANEMNVKSRWQAEYDRYRDSADYSNATSQTAYGVHRYDAEWQHICGDSATFVANHLVGNSDGIWTSQHVVVEFDTFGARDADIELGDWFECNFDSHVLCYGESWVGKQFIVCEIRNSVFSTHIKGVELYG